MKEILRITVGLTISCILAGLVMGAVFTMTDKAKKHNEQMDFQETMLGVLGYSGSNPAPSDLKFHSVYRYIIRDQKARFLGYMVPVDRAGKETYELLVLDLEGKLKGHYDVDISPAAAMEMPQREEALKRVLNPPNVFTFADSFIVAMLGSKRLAYLMPGEFPGFKTFIRVMLAVDPHFKIKGLDIMEQEEDPGLGGEIAQDYFKNQFIDKSYDRIKSLKVIKKPLPADYRTYLEREKGERHMPTREQIEKTQKKYADSDIYALTGATISSRSMTRGIKNMVKKFAYRANILDHVIARGNIPVVF